MRDNIVEVREEYKTWFHFKRDLEIKLGKAVPVDLWLRTRPKKPLPWCKADFETTLSEVSAILQARKKSQLISLRDIVY
jgi:hypothetical protein